MRTCQEKSKNGFLFRLYYREVKSVTEIQGPDPEKQERLTVLIRRYEKGILRICYLYLHDEEQAKDAVQDTFLKAYMHLDGLQDKGKEKSWLMKIAVNTCRDYLRSSWAVHINRYVRPENLPAAAEPQNESYAELTAAIMNLPAKYMEAVALRYIQGYDILETAEILGITPSAVSRRCRKACARLKQELEGGNDQDE